MDVILFITVLAIWAVLFVTVITELYLVKKIDGIEAEVEKLKERDPAGPDALHWKLP